MNVYGLIGNPVSQSLSPPMHEAGYRVLELDARYVTFEPEKDAGPAAVQASQTLGIDGLNVTIPFKQAVLSVVEPDEQAARVGAVNTIDLGTDPPTGHNTDVDGAIRALEHFDAPIESARTVVLGAGGAGRAISVGLHDAGAEVTVANRTVKRAQELASEFHGIEAAELDDVPQLIEEADLLVNATSVGMGEDVSPVDPNVLHSDLFVMDAVYHPLETRLLKDAKAAGSTTVDGGWMLLYQGVAAFERWLDVEVPIDAMNEALRAQL